MSDHHDQHDHQAHHDHHGQHDRSGSSEKKGPHGHGSGHDHEHGHGHHHGAVGDFSRAYGIGVALNLAFVAAEVVYGLAANSLALLADAGHNAGDVLGLLLAWGAAWLAQRKPHGRYTYGLRSASILAALANAVLLLVASGGIGVEALRRFAEPQPIGGMTVIIVALLGVAINGATAWLFMKGRHGDLNVRGAFLHMAADAGVSLGVAGSGLVILMTGWLWLDPVVSLAIAAVIIAATWGLLRDSFDLALHAAPRFIETEKVKSFLGSLPAVTEVHDLHIWAMSTTDTALSAHLLMAGGHPGDRFLEEVGHRLEEDFRIGHATIQIELGDGACACRLAPDHVV